MTLDEILITEKKHRLHYQARWNPENMWYDIVDVHNRVVAKDVSPSEQRAKQLAASYQPGQVIEGSSRSHSG